MAKNFKARDVHIIRRAILRMLFPNCPVCGYALNGQAFTLDLGDGDMDEFSTRDAQVDIAHLEAKSKTGQNTANNFCLMHHACNTMQGTKTLEVFCKRVRTVQTADEIRHLSMLGEWIGDKILNDVPNQYTTQVLRIARQMMIEEQKTNRTGAKWEKRILAA